MGNFADMAVEGHFTLLFVVFNTFFGLLCQDDQVRCVQGVAQQVVLTDQGMRFYPVQVRYSPADGVSQAPESLLRCGQQY